MWQPPSWAHPLSIFEQRTVVYFNKMHASEVVGPDFLMKLLASESDLYREGYLTVQYI